MRRFVLPFLAFVLLAFLFVAPAVAGDEPTVDDGVRERVLRQRVLGKARELPRPPGDPDKAALYAARQRAVPGVDVDPWPIYEAARRYTASLPGYSTQLGRHLPSDDQRAELRTKNQVGTWESLGPGNIGGRTRALVLDPRDPDVMYAGGVSGGVWKTNDGGGHWRPLGDLLPNIAVSAIAIDPGDPRVVYAGTGEGYFREVIRETSLPLRGAGIFKSTDAGGSWTRLATTWGPDFRWVNDIVVSPTDSRRVYAATRTGVWRSANGGRTWTRSLATENNGLATDVTSGCLDMEIRTDRRTDVVFAACGTFEQATIFRNPRTEDAASPWIAVLTEEGMGRTTLALAPSNQNTIYALSASYVGGPGGVFNGGLHAVFRSDAAGTSGSWRAVNRNDDTNRLDTVLLSNPVIAHLVECGFDSQNFVSNLGWHANVIAVDPSDPDVVFTGGVDLFRSNDGGASWGPISHWHDSPPSSHADHHVIVFHPDYDGATNQTMWDAGDGGVWRTDNARARKGSGNQATCSSASTSVRWRALNNNYGVTQFYHGAVFPGGRRFPGRHPGQRHDSRRGQARYRRLV